MSEGAHSPGIDLATADHVVDAVDQQIEMAVARVEHLISVAEETSEPLAAEAQAAIVGRLQGATEQIEQAVERVDAMVAPAEDALGTSGATAHPPQDELVEATGQVGQAVAQIETIIAATEASQDSVADGHGQRDAGVDNLGQATQRFKAAVHDVETLVVAAQEESRGGHAEVEQRHVRHETEQAIRPKRG